MVVLAAAGVALFWSSDSGALDPPHDTLTDVCTACHTGHGASYPTILGTLCEECHVEGGTATPVNTHSSRFIDNGYGNWEVDCWGCHDPHAQEQWSWTTAPDPNYNGKLVRRDLNAQIKEINPGDPGPYWSPYSGPGSETGTGTYRTETSSNVEFDANFVGPGFVDGDGVSDDDICQTCHEETSNYNHPLGFLNSHTDYGEDSQPGGNCMACHDHAEGFAVAGGGGCTSCHASLQPGGAPPTGEYRRQVAGAGGDFERKTHHVTDGTTTEIIADADCQVCHAQDDHQLNTDPQVLLYNADDHATIYTYDGSGSSLEPFCLSCHDANGSAVDGAQPYSDGRTPPDIATRWNAAGAPHAGLTEKCIACHGGADSTDATLPDYEHNVHGSCNDIMLSSRVAGGAVMPTVALLRIDDIGRNYVFEINVDGTLVAQYTAGGKDTVDMARDDLIADINGGSHGLLISAEIIGPGPMSFAVKPTDACATPFNIDLGATEVIDAGPPPVTAMVLGPKITAASYVCLECHDANGPATRNVAAEFDVGPGAPLYGIFFSEQYGAVLSRTHDLAVAINCNDCHDPHGSNGLGFELLLDTDPKYSWRTLRADPDPLNTGGRDVVPGDSDGDGIPDSRADGRLWTNAPTPSTWLTEWCLACHDGSMPPSLNLPAQLVNIEDAWLNAASPNFNKHGFETAGTDAAVSCESGYQADPGCTSGVDIPATNVVLNCTACHNAGHNVDSQMYQTRTYPLAADGHALTTLFDGTTPVEPLLDPEADGENWCDACHDTAMNGACQGCHQHGDATRF